jgi:succinate dehydrogenase / fumarate reductase, cytochrome b subunit|tara:strand:+ start:148 stop:573 length:426 start_codon:yes stop_codon:yes gene_type:complete
MDQKSDTSLSTHALHKKRPLSPHISIYKPQITSITSILHRLTGIYLYLGLVILAWTIFSLVYFPNVLEGIGIFLSNHPIIDIIFKITLLMWTYSLFYHQLNGIRHLFWDAGKGFDLTVVDITGKLVLILSVLLTLICWAAI